MWAYWVKQLILSTFGSLVKRDAWGCQIMSKALFPYGPAAGAASSLGLRGEMSAFFPSLDWRRSCVCVCVCVRVCVYALRGGRIELKEKVRCQIGRVHREAEGKKTGGKNLRFFATTSPKGLRGGEGAGGRKKAEKGRAPGCTRVPL